jgi:hypothetical protein
MRKIFGTMMAVGLALSVTPGARAQPDYVGTPFPVSPAVGDGLPSPLQVTGKEYVDLPNRDHFNVAVLGQTLMWDGLGGRANSTLFPVTRNIDAMANHGDSLFQALIQDQSHLLVSVTGDSPLNSIWYERRITGATGVWATKAQINNSGVNDLIGLEVWGADFVDDTDRISLVGDPGGVSVFAAVGNVLTPYISQVQIANFIHHPELATQIDLDALMVNDNGDDLFGPGDSIVFSIEPLGAFDGGEIWVMNGDGSGGYLFHGGHVWDTAFNVMAAFDVANENIDAIEAVSIPEPGAWLLTGIGLAAFLTFRRRS